MKVLQIITRSDSIGGAQIHLKDLSRELLSRGVEIHLIAGTGPYLNEMRAYGIKVHPVSSLIRQVHPYYDWLAFWQMRKIMKEIKPSLVATHSSKAGWLGRAAARSLRIPVIFTAHGWSFTEGVPAIRGWIYTLAEKAAGYMTDRIITVSEYDRRLCLRKGVAPDSKLVTIHNGIPDMFCSVKRERAAITRLMMTARLEKPKNPLFLLQALAELPRDDWELVLAGEGRQRAEIEEYILRWKLTPRVRLLGERNDIPELLAGADIFLLLSDWEGLPISILEAMRAGLPVIASHVGGVPELLDDGVEGFLITRNDLGMLKACLLSLIGDPQLRTMMGMAARKKYEEKFRIEDMIKKTLSVYDSVQKKT